MRFKLEINDEEILAFVETATRRAIQTAISEGLETAAIYKDDVSTSGAIVASNIVNTFVTNAVTMKLRTLSMKLTEGNLVERSERDCAREETDEAQRSEGNVREAQPSDTACRAPSGDS